MEGELRSVESDLSRAEDVAAERFARALAAHAPNHLDETLERELRAEAATVLDSFTRAADDVGLRESFALSGLLARRAAELGASGMEVAAVMEALEQALGASGPRLTDDHRCALRGIMIESFTRALEDRVKAEELRARIACTRPFVLAPRCAALVLQGAPVAEWIGAAVEGLGPVLLASDAGAVVVLSRFDEVPSAGAIAELAACVEVASVVGARVFFSVQEGTAEPLRARLGERAVVLVEDPSGAIERGMSAADGSVVRARVAGLLRRLGV